MFHVLILWCFLQIHFTQTWNLYNSFLGEHKYSIWMFACVNLYCICHLIVSREEAFNFANASNLFAAYMTLVITSLYCSNFLSFPKICIVSESVIYIILFNIFDFYHKVWCKQLLILISSCLSLKPSCCDTGKHFCCAWSFLSCISGIYLNI